MTNKNKNQSTEDSNFSDIICKVTKENEQFLHENAEEAWDEFVYLTLDSINYVSDSVKRHKEHSVKYSMDFFAQLILMPLSYAIITDILSGNLPACFMELRLMLESLVKCYLADLRYPEKTFFQEKLEELEKDLGREKKSTSKVMKEIGDELNLDFVALWSKLSNDWIHTKGLSDRIVNRIAEKSDIPAYALVIPMNLNKSGLDDIGELQKRISQFRILLNATMEKHQQNHQFKDLSL